MMNERDSQARLALTALAILIGGFAILDIQDVIISKEGIFLWMMPIVLLCTSLILFAYGEDGEFLLGPGIVITAGFILNFSTAVLVVKSGSMRPSFLTDSFVNNLNGLVNAVFIIFAIFLFIRRIKERASRG